MPQRQQVICSNCGRDVGIDFPDNPVLTYIVSGRLRSAGDGEVEMDALNPGVAAMLMLDLPRIELCPDCANAVLDFDAEFVDAIVETANRQEMNKSPRDEGKLERLRMRRAAIRSLLAERKTPKRMAKTQVKESRAFDSSAHALIVGDTVVAPPAAVWFEPPRPAANPLAEETPPDHVVPTEEEA